MTCEDADDGFKPTCGSIDELNFRTSPDVWGYFSVKSGGGIHEFSDSQVNPWARLSLLIPRIQAPFAEFLARLRLVTLFSLLGAA